MAPHQSLGLRRALYVLVCAVGAPRVLDYFRMVAPFLLMRGVSLIFSIFLFIFAFIYLSGCVCMM